MVICACVTYASQSGLLGDSRLCRNGPGDFYACFVSMLLMIYYSVQKGRRAIKAVSRMPGRDCGFVDEWNEARIAAREVQ